MVSGYGVVKFGLLFCFCVVGIRVDESVKRMLDEYVRCLSERRGHCVDYSDVLLYLLRSRRKYPALLIEACMPMDGAEEDKLALYKNRKMDEKVGSFHF